MAKSKTNKVKDTKWDIRIGPNGFSTKNCVKVNGERLSDVTSIKVYLPSWKSITNVEIGIDLPKNIVAKGLTDKNVRIISHNIAEKTIIEAL